MVYREVEENCVNELGKSLGDDSGRCRRLSACEDKCENYRSGIMW